MNSASCYNYYLHEMYNMTYSIKHRVTHFSVSGSRSWPHTSNMHKKKEKMKLKQNLRKRDNYKL